MTSTESNVGYSQSSDGYQSKQAPKALFSECIISSHFIVASLKNSLTIRPSAAGIDDVGDANNVSFHIVFPNLVARARIVPCNTDSPNHVNGLRSET